MAKKKKKDRVVTRSFTIYESDYEKLQRIGHDNASKGLRKVVNEHKGIIPKGE